MKIEVQANRMGETVELMIENLCVDETLKKAQEINDKQSFVFSHNIKEEILNIIFKKSDNKEIKININQKEKLIYQEYENDADIYSLQNHKQYLPYLAKWLLIHKENPSIEKLIENIFTNLKEWEFEYHQPEG